MVARCGEGVSSLLTRVCEDDGERDFAVRVGPDTRHLRMRYMILAPVGHPGCGEPNKAGA